MAAVKMGGALYLVHSALIPFQTFRYNLFSQNIIISYWCSCILSFISNCSDRCQIPHYCGDERSVAKYPLLRAVQSVQCSGGAGRDDLYRVILLSITRLLPSSHLSPHTFTPWSRHLAILCVKVRAVHMWEWWAAHIPPLLTVCRHRSCPEIRS